MSGCGNGVMQRARRYRPQFEVRVLGPTAMEDYHAHLMRLDRTSRFPGMDDRAIDAHCLHLINAGAILVGVYEEGVMRAAAEIVPDRTARRAEAAITVENHYEERGFERELTDRVLEEARRHHLHNVRLHEHDATRIHKIPPFELRAVAVNE